MKRLYRCPKCNSGNYIIIIHEDRYPVAKILQCKKCGHTFSKDDGLDTRIKFNNIIEKAERKIKKIVDENTGGALHLKYCFEDNIVSETLNLIKGIIGK